MINSNHITVKIPLIIIIIIDLQSNDRISDELENTISNVGWQEEPMKRCLTYSVPSREIVFQTDQSVCDGAGVTVCKKRIGIAWAFHFY